MTQTQRLTGVRASKQDVQCLVLGTTLGYPVQNINVKRNFGRFVVIGIIPVLPVGHVVVTNGCIKAYAECIPHHFGDRSHVEKLFVAFLWWQIGV
ncbi:hypothetical protein D3C81_1815240 [compost metagenome]